MQQDDRIKNMSELIQTNLYIRGHKTLPFMARMDGGRSVSIYHKLGPSDRKN